MPPLKLAIDDMNFVKYQFLTLIVVLLSTCSSSVSKQELAFEVLYKGALKNIMHKGETTAQAELKKLQNTQHLYALGALENLKGEILILDDEAFISSAQDEGVMISPSFDHKATLLVYSNIKKWQTLVIPEQIKTYDELEIFIEKMAHEKGIDTQAPFPFLMHGIVESLDWHVINWPEGDKEHSHEKHIKSGLNGSISKQEVDVLGFYSNSHHAIFTHHTTNMHLHFKTSDNKLSGHLDGMTLGGGMTLQLPR